MSKIGTVGWCVVLALIACASTAAAQAGTLTVFVAGDIMLARGVAGKIAREGADYPYADMRGQISHADFALANLECALLAGGPHHRREMVFRGDPAQAAALKRAGFSAMILANNHVPNYGPSGVLDTIQALNSAGLATVGAGRDAALAAAPLIFEKNGIRVAVLAYNAPDVVPASYFASPNHAGTNRLDLTEAAAAIRAARERADYVIVSMHAGTEYQARPNRMQQAFAHAAVDAGADLVVGHHPHVVQTEEIYRGKPIFYSLGNFVFDQDWSPATQQGLALEVEISLPEPGAAVAHITPVPVLLRGFRPEPATGAEARQILNRLTDRRLSPRAQLPVGWWKGSAASPAWVRAKPASCRGAAVPDRASR